MRYAGEYFMNEGFRVNDGAMTFSEDKGGLSESEKLRELARFRADKLMPGLGFMPTPRDTGAPSPAWSLNTGHWLDGTEPAEAYEV